MQQNIILFTSEHCKQCEDVKQRLHKQNITFIEESITNYGTINKLKQILKLTQNMHITNLDNLELPIIVKNKKVIKYEEL